MEDIGIKEVIEAKERQQVLEWIRELFDSLQALDADVQRLRQLKNEVTYLHNELNEVKKNLGMDGSVPRVKTTKRRYTYE